MSEEKRVREQEYEVTILEEILAEKRREVDERKALYPIELLEKSAYFHSPPVSLTEYLRREDRIGVIAEFKRRSPSRGFLHEFADVLTVASGYMQAGSSALSILTDKKFFGGTAEDLSNVRSHNFCPILRKDFIIDEYQIIEARSIGADVILLIAAALTEDQMKRFGTLARELNLEVLVEVHSQEELERVPFEAVDAIGVNNRDLKTFVVDLETSYTLFPQIPSSHVAVSESGIRTAAELVALRQLGFRGFLIGERFMSESRPEEACRAFIRQAEALLHVC
ncbi:indole-3-glycerol phosphate synthase TrpC [bacterium]|nr:indole-3-glycerol phosphate synthase TrpC [bacterium]